MWNSWNRCSFRWNRFSRLRWRPDRGETSSPALQGSLVVVGDGEAESFRVAARRKDMREKRWKKKSVKYTRSHKTGCRTWRIGVPIIHSLEDKKTPRLVTSGMLSIPFGLVLGSTLGAKLDPQPACSPINIPYITPHMHSISIGRPPNLGRP